MNTSDNPLDLGNGFILRHATVEDTAALVEMQIHAFANPDTGELEIYVGGWTRDLMGGKHPTFRPNNFLIVVETATNKIVSCLCLISQTWSLDGISFPVGQVEIVGTDAGYRRRGLVREQFRVVHEMSAQRGELLQAITGIPFYYRQFGYEFAIELPAPYQTFVPQQIPTLNAGEIDNYQLRHAGPADLPFVAEMYKLGAKRSLLHCERDPATLEYENFNETDPLNGQQSWWDVIETLEGERVGVIMRRRHLHQGQHRTLCYEIQPPFEWHEVTPFVLRELARQAGEIAGQDNSVLGSLGWNLSSNHPFYTVTAGRTSQIFGPYAWYIRVADLPAFFTKIAPVLEQRLAASELRNYSGEIALNFYRNGLRVKFENGKLTVAGLWQPTAVDIGQKGFGDAAFPDLTFLKLLFGYRSRVELADMYPDCIVDSDRNKALLDILFPKRVTHIMPVH